jgi:transcriptional regulator with XRE-family HTH domain
MGLDSRAFDAEILVAEGLRHRSWKVRDCSAQGGQDLPCRCRTLPLCADLSVYSLAGKMPVTSEKTLSDAENRAVAAIIREEIARRRITRQLLADQAKISISTLEKALSGRRPFTLATTIRLEEALGVSLRKRETGAAVNSVPVGVAPHELGSYSRPAVSWIEGSYLTLRPSFGDEHAVYAYQTDIRWDEGRSCLVFRESERIDSAFAHHGSVSIPHQSGHIYMIVTRHGQYRLIIVARPNINGEMHGILTTLHAGRGAQLTPVASPIVFVPSRNFAALHFGRIGAQHKCHRIYREYLKRTIEEPFALFL